jgi:hypothetical protein
MVKILLLYTSQIIPITLESHPISYTDQPWAKNKPKFLQNKTLL